MVAHLFYPRLKSLNWFINRFGSYNISWVGAFFFNCCWIINQIERISSLIFDWSSHRRKRFRKFEEAFIKAFFWTIWGWRMKLFLKYKNFNLNELFTMEYSKNLRMYTLRRPLHFFKSEKVCQLNIIFMMYSTKNMIHFPISVRSSYLQSTMSERRCLCRIRYVGLRSAQVFVPKSLHW